VEEEQKTCYVKKRGEVSLSTRLREEAKKKECSRETKKKLRAGASFSQGYKKRERSIKKEDRREKREEGGISFISMATKDCMIWLWNKIPPAGRSLYAEDAEKRKK